LNSARVLYFASPESVRIIAYPAVLIITVLGLIVWHQVGISLVSGHARFYGVAYMFEKVLLGLELLCLISMPSGTDFRTLELRTFDIFYNKMIW